MSFIDARKLSALVDSAHCASEHLGYLALQPICDLIEAAANWLSGRGRQQSERPSLPPRA